MEEYSTDKRYQPMIAMGYAASQNTADKRPNSIRTRNR